MKYLKTFLVALIITATAASIQAQTPELINYQAVVRNSTGEVLATQQVGLRIAILSSSATGTEVFSEEHFVTTNDFGLVNFSIGSGTNQTGSIGAIDWGTNQYFVKVSLDPTGGTTFTEMGTSQLLSVPYALHAETVENDEVDDADADPNNEIQQLSLVNDTIFLSDGGSIVLPAPPVNFDNDTTNELNHDLELNGTSLALTDEGGTLVVELSSLIEDADSDTTNELISTVSLNGSDLEVTDAGGTIVTDLSSLVNDADADSTNELQSLTLSGDIITLSDGGAADLSHLNDTGAINSIDSALSAHISMDADVDSTNELQSLSISGDVITLSDGGTADLSHLNDTGAINSIDSALSAHISMDADIDSTNELQSLTLSGDVITLSDGGTADLSHLNDTGAINSIDSALSAHVLDDADTSATNEIQVLSISNDTIYLSNGGFAVLPVDQVEDADADITNEIQALSIANDTLSLSNGGGSVDMAGYLDNTDSQDIADVLQQSNNADTISIINLGDVQLNANSALCFGDPNANGSWRMRLVSGQLIFEMRESGNWIEKVSIRE